jgi:hypothetical protein
VTVYADMILLAHVQRRILDELADDFASLDPHARSWSHAAALDARVTEFRNRLWWPDVCSSRLATRILADSQVQLNSPALFERLVEDLRDFRSSVSASELADISAKQEEAAHRQRQFEGQAKVFGSVAVAVGIVLTFFSVNVNNADWLGWQSDGPDGIPGERVLAAAAMVALLAALISVLLVKRGYRKK